MSSAQPTASPRPIRSIAFAGYLAYLYGILGILIGITAAGTFIPFATLSTYDPSLAGVLTGIAIAGTAASALGIVAGWGLFRFRPSAWTTALGVSGICVGLNVVIAALWPGYALFVIPVAIAYGLMIALLFIGRSTYTARASRPAAA
jgi:hypothetical protein